MAGEEKGVIRIISNKHIERAESITWTATEGNITLISADTIEIRAEGGIVFGDYEPPPKKKPKKKHFIDGWWSSDAEGKERITEAEIGDVVYFHVETREIPDHKIVFMTLQEDDRVANEAEDDENEKLNLEKDDPKNPGKKMPSLFEKVINNKTSKKLALVNLDRFFKDEQDEELELFFACSYEREHVDLPWEPSAYLKVRKKEPIVVLVNGYWNKGILEDLAGGEYGEPYWGDEFKIRTKQYFNTQKLFYVNGAGEKGDGGAKRFNMGKKFAEERFNNPQSNFYQKVLKASQNNEGKYTGPVVFVSHSMGGAFAEGMVSYLHAQGVQIAKVAHFSSADNGGFRVTLPDKTYQIDVEKDIVLLYKNFDDTNFIENVRCAGIVSKIEINNDTFYGHYYTKALSIPWDWLEDLETIQFNYLETKDEYTRIPSDGLGPATTMKTTKKIYGSKTKNSTQFLLIFKNGMLYNQHDKDEYSVN